MTELNKNNKVEITLPIKVERTSKSRRKAVAAALDLPEDRQPDLLYFSGIMVSSGENLNHAFFLPSELVKAEKTIVNKAVDKEHKEDVVIGHIYDKIFVDKEGNVVDFEEIANMETADINKLDLDVIIAGIIYKTRFPEEAEQVKNGDWSLSMEAYFKDFDVKIGDVLIPRKEAEALGLTEACIGKKATVKAGEKDLAAGPVTRVLRDIMFAGCGIVKNPANPASIFLDTAALKTDDKNEAVVLRNIEEVTKEADVKVAVDEKTKSKEDADWIAQPAPDNSLRGPGGTKQDTVGQCIHFRRFAEDAGEGGDNDWCELYHEACTSEYREQRDPNCLRYKDFIVEMKGLVEQVVAELSEGKTQADQTEFLDTLKEALQIAIDKAAKKCGSPMSKKNKKKKKKSKDSDGNDY